MSDYKPLYCPYKEVYCLHRPFYGIDEVTGDFKSPREGVDIRILNKYGFKQAPCPKWRMDHCVDEE